MEWQNKGIDSIDADKILNKQSSSRLSKQKNTKTENPLALKYSSNMDLIQKARELYEDNSSIKIFPLCIQDKRFPWLISSIDGFSEDFSKLVKIGFEDLEYKEAEKGIYPRAILQHQLMITGLEEIDYWCYQDNQKGILIRVKRDQDMIDKLYQKERLFAELLNK